MPEPTAAVPSNALSGIQSLPLRQRLRRVAPYFWGNLRWTWAGALLATLVGAATEPLIPALLKPLLDNGFTQGGSTCGWFRCSSLACFLCVGLHNLSRNTR